MTSYCALVGLIVIVGAIWLAIKDSQAERGGR